jgi:LPS-assembly lipoprotein
MPPPLNPLPSSLAPHAPLVQTSRMTRFLMAAMAALLLSACGFHLRGALTLPADIGPIRVTSPDPYSPLAQGLAQALERSGGQASVDGPREGVATLNIIGEQWGSNPIAVDAQGRALEFTLQYATVFDMRRADGSVAVPRQTIELGRDYVAPPTDSDGAEAEREILVRELRREMIASMLRRIDAVSKAPRPAASEALPTP